MLCGEQLARAGCAVCVGDAVRDERRWRWEAPAVPWRTHRRPARCRNQPDRASCTGTFLSMHFSALSLLIDMVQIDVWFHKRTLLTFNFICRRNFQLFAISILKLTDIFKYILNGKLFLFFPLLFVFFLPTLCTVQYSFSYSNTMRKLVIMINRSILGN